MFILIAVVCAGPQAQDCTVLAWMKEMFPTYEACDVVRNEQGPKIPAFYVSARCLQLPGTTL